jgi:hypothetical protein
MSYCQPVGHPLTTFRNTVTGFVKLNKSLQFGPHSQQEILTGWVNGLYSASIPPDSEGLEPRLRSRKFGIAERIRNRGC